ncbi:MAG: peptidoglycan-binding protein [Peptococcaceae bacterium]|nr:peptidoglycan-binding protein [Peptococcaceae bacterium]
MRRLRRFFLSTIVCGLLLTFPLMAAHGEQPVLKKGMSGDDVIRLQVKLQELGYYRGEVDGIFGSGTCDAVAGFQASNNLAVDGVAGPETLRALKFFNTEASRGGDGRGGAAEGQKALKLGTSGDGVLTLQKKLRELGYYQGALDGVFGPGTHAAVVNFQVDNNLEVDGVAGAETLQALTGAAPRQSLASRGQGGDRKAQAIVSYARQFLGVPYVWAGSSPSGFDCSGFTYYVFGQFGIDLPRMANEQFNTGVRVSKLQPGDLVFFSTYEPGPSHVGIYIGSNSFIHASSGAGNVTITSLSAPFYAERYLGARRVLN